MAAVGEELPGMPVPERLVRVSSDGETVILRGRHVVGRYEDDDIGMRNLIIVSLREIGHSGKDVAACFGLSHEYVSELRQRAKRQGSVGIVCERGRPRKLTGARLARVRSWAKEGVSNKEIARRSGVHPGTIGRLLERHHSEQTPDHESSLLFDEQTPAQGTVADTAGEPDVAPAREDPEPTREPEGRPAPDERAQAPSSSIEEGERTSRYAGAMLLHPFLSALGADDICSSIPRGVARRYDATSLVLSATFGFSLGISSLEGAKHLRRQDAGALVGLSSFPHLRTLRPALGSLAEATDPLALQRSFAKGMLANDERPPELFYVDDHFVTYWGARPVAKGYNIRRHLAEPGRETTFVVDEDWRAICFSSGEPRGLSVSLPEILGQLKEVVGDGPAMVGFDRGGSYPKVFSALYQAGMDWVTWRRAPLVAPSVPARRTWVTRDGRRRYLLVCDETIELTGYEGGPVRQLSATEGGKIVFQVLTSNFAFRPAPLVFKLKGRWSIENFNKYAEDHYGVHWLSTYEMDEEDDTQLVKNPERSAARATLRAATTALSDAERALGQAMEEDHQSVTARIAAVTERRDDVTVAKDAIEAAKAAVKGVPARLPANEVHPGKKRAKPRLAVRALQMVCRLLSYNAELDLARRLNAYLDDPDEYRVITRNLLHLSGTITHRRARVEVTLDRPDAPRVARALGLLIDELNAGPVVHMTGDRRPLTYRLAPSELNS